MNPIRSGLFSASTSPPPPVAEGVRPSKGVRVAQAAAFIYCFQTYYIPNFLLVFSVHVFTFRTFRPLRVIAKHLLRQLTQQASDAPTFSTTSK